MRARLVIALSGVILAGSIGAAGQNPGAPVSADRREWGQRYGRLSGALLKKDYKAFRDMVATDATWTLAGGKRLNTGQMQAALARKLDFVRPNTQFTMNITKLTVSGNAAAVERTQVIAGFYSDSKGDKRRAFDGSGWEDRWVKTAKGWKLKSAKQFNEMLTVDGRPADPYALSPKSVPPKKDKPQPRRTTRG